MFFEFRWISRFVIFTASNPYLLYFKRARELKKDKKLVGNPAPLASKSKRIKNKETFENVYSVILEELSAYDPTESI